MALEDDLAALVRFVVKEELERFGSGLEARPLAVSRREAARLLGVSEPVLANRIRAGLVPTVHDQLAYSRPLIPRRWLEELVDGAADQGRKKTTEPVTPRSGDP